MKYLFAFLFLQLFDYPLENGRHAIVVVQDGISASEAKQMARERAAAITVEMGGRYFTIDTEAEVKLIKPDGGWPSQQNFYRNMYQELIIQGNFGKGREEKIKAQNPGENVYPATRLTFTIYSSKPKDRQAIDACTLTDCQ